MAKRAAMRRKPTVHVTAVTSDIPTREIKASPPTSGGPLEEAKDGIVRKLREDLIAAQKALDVSSVRQGQMLQEGLLLVKLDPRQIRDAVGSDRSDRLGPEDKFDELKEDIRKRGQRTPIRVRPDASDWQPDKMGQVAEADRFILQSGRRRLQACVELNEPIVAIVTAVTQDTDAKLDDLVERFSENAIRADLTGFENYLSIGEIAEHLDDMNQSEVSEILSVAREEVSVGQAVFRYQDDLIGMIGEEVRSLSKRQVRPLIARVKRWIVDGRPDLNQVPIKKDRITAERRPGSVVLSSGLSATATQSGSIRIEVEGGRKPSAKELEWILDAIAKGAGRLN